MEPTQLDGTALSEVLPWYDPSSDATLAHACRLWLQVNQAFLEKYAKTQGKEVQRILMYSRKHPCGKCASLLVDICKKLKQQTGLGKAFKCDVVYALPFKNYQDKAVRQKMEATGEVTVQQIAALAQLCGVGMQCPRGPIKAVWKAGHVHASF